MLFRAIQCKRASVSKELSLSGSSLSKFDVLLVVLFGQAARRSLPADFLSKTKKMAAKKSVRNDAVREKLSQELSQGMFRTFFADGSMEPNKDEEEDDSLVSPIHCYNGSAMTNAA